MKKIVLLIILFIITGIPAFSEDKPISYTLADRDRLTRVEAKIDEMDKRFSELKDDMNKRFDMLITLMIGIIGAFTAIVAGAIGFALWDRRSFIKPFEIKVQEIDNKNVNQDRDIIKNKELSDQIVYSLRELAKHDKPLAEILKQAKLL